MNSLPNVSDRIDSSTTIVIPPDPYDEWLSLPVPGTSPDPRFEVRRAEEHEFERVYDCVDAAFGTKRPREAYDWMYRQNPYGRAQVWITIEKASDRLVKTGANYPWPIWRGREVIVGTLSGDSATVPDWQRKGLSRVRRAVRRSHPWQGKRCSIAGPNENSRIVSIKDGEGHEILGRLPGGAIPLQLADETSRLPRALRTALNRTLDGVMTGWRAVSLRHRDPAVRLEHLQRFTPEFDAVTLSTMDFAGYWSPHSWKFLNWRYLDHPTETHSALALLRDETPIGYTVVRHTGSRAALVEFAVADTDAGAANQLLVGAIDLARSAGCVVLTFFATPAWRHWRLFHRAGMIPVPTNNYLEASYDLDPEGSLDSRNWQLTPGDRDYH
jgi:hypothetical protein